MSLRETQLALGVLLDCDIQLERRRQQIAGLDQGTQLAAQYRTKKPLADSLRLAANVAHAAQKHSELELSSLESKIKVSTDKLYSGKVTSPRELEDLQQGINALGRQKATIEDEVLVLMEAAGDAEALAGAAELVVARLTKEYKTLKDTNAKREAELTNEIAQLLPSRSAAAKGVPDKTFLAQYEAIKARLRNVGAGRLTSSRTCSACGMMSNGTTFNTVNDGLMMAYCEHCSRILIP